MATEAGIPAIRTVQCQTRLKTGGGTGLTWNSEVSLGAHPHVLGIHLVTAVSPGGAQPAHSAAAQAHPAPPAASHGHRAHPGNCWWTLRLPSAAAVTAMVGISRWSFLPRKTLQSDTMETTNQRPENCKAAPWAAGQGTQGHKADSPEPGPVCSQVSRVSTSWMEKNPVLTHQEQVTSPVSLSTQCGMGQ